MPKSGTSAAADRIAAAKRREERTLKEVETARAEKAEKTQRLRALRRAKEAADSPASRSVPAKARRTPGLPQGRRGLF